MTKRKTRRKRKIIAYKVGEIHSWMVGNYVQIGRVLTPIYEK